MTRIIQNCISWIKIIHLWWLQMVNNHPFLDVPWFNWWCWWCCACPTLQMLEQRGGFAIRIFLEGLVLSWDCSNWSSWRVHDCCYGQFVFHDKHFNCRELSDLNKLYLDILNSEWVFFRRWLVIVRWVFYSYTTAVLQEMIQKNALIHGTKVLEGQRVEEMQYAGGTQKYLQ